MIFRRIIFNAVLVGLVTGLLLSVVQTFGLTNIIYQAETYEVAEEPAAEAGHHHDHGDGHGHHHDAEAWAPEDGAERISFTFMANILAAIGFASLILALMSQLQLQGITKLTLGKGLLWGLAGFIAFFVAPGLGLAPEIPGTEAAVIEYRQAWWMFAVICAAVGLGVLAFTPVKWKGLGAVLLALPYIVGAPHVDGPEFTHPDPDAVAALQELHHQFIIATGVSNLLFWAVLGVACAWVLNKWVLAGVETSAH